MSPVRTDLARRSLLLGLASSLAGCGFHPVYGPLAKGGGTVRPELAAIYVAVMPERQGQLLRQALQRRFEGADADVTKRYELTGGLVTSNEALGIQSDTSASRVRINGSASWTLTAFGSKPVIVTRGVAKATDGFNINNQQYFALDLENSAAVKRIAETIADQIALDLAVFFRKRADTA